MDDDTIEEDLDSSPLNLTRTVTEEVEDLVDSDGGHPEQYNSDDFEEDYEDEDFEDDEDNHAAQDNATGTDKALARKLLVEKTGILDHPCR